MGRKWCKIPLSQMCSDSFLSLELISAVSSPYPVFHTPRSISSSVLPVLSKTGDCPRHCVGISKGVNWHSRLYAYFKSLGNPATPPPYLSPGKI